MPRVTLRIALVAVLGLGIDPARASSDYLPFPAFVNGERWHEFKADDLRLPGCTTQAQKRTVPNRTVVEFVVDCKDFSAVVKPHFHPRDAAEQLRQGMLMTLRIEASSLPADKVEQAKERYARIAQHIPIWITPKSNPCDAEKWASDWRELPLRVAEKISGFIEFLSAKYAANGDLILPSITKGEFPSFRRAKPRCGER